MSEVHTIEAGQLVAHRDHPSDMLGKVYEVDGGVVVIDVFWWRGRRPKVEHAVGDLVPWAAPFAEGQAVALRASSRKLLGVVVSFAAGLLDPDDPASKQCFATVKCCYGATGAYDVERLVVWDGAIDLAKIGPRAGMTGDAT